MAALSFLASTLRHRFSRGTARRQETHKKSSVRNRYAVLLFDVREKKRVLLAERGGFEPPIEVLAPITV
jgi:hypothetical protein